MTKVRRIPLNVDYKGPPVHHPPVPAHKVKIFRSTSIDSSKYQEIGMIVVSGTNPDIVDIFQRMRKEAAKNGAAFVFNFKLKGRIHKTDVIDSENNISFDVDKETRYSASATLAVPISSK
ncbi:MAG: hypothetical protein GY757_60035 [bacterium]|nr:hypothetical protein [bacterium]